MLRGCEWEGSWSTQFKQRMEVSWTPVCCGRCSSSNSGRCCWTNSLDFLWVWRPWLWLAKLRSRALSRAAQSQRREVLKCGDLGSSSRLEVEGGGLEGGSQDLTLCCSPEWARGEWGWGGVGEEHTGWGQVGGVVSKVGFQLGSWRRGWGAEILLKDLGGWLTGSFLFPCPPPTQDPGLSRHLRPGVYLGSSEN